MDMPYSQIVQTDMPPIQRIKHHQSGAQFSQLLALQLKVEGTGKHVRGKCALHFPGAGNRAVTPRRVAVRVIRTGSPMGGPAPPVLSYPGVPEKGWCRTPPPGPVAFVRFHPPTILEGTRAERWTLGIQESLDWTGFRRLPQ
eukprot:s24_g8.t1